MLNILKNSYAYKIYITITAFFHRMWTDSFVVKKFLAPNRALEISRSSIFTRMWNAFRNGLCAVFDKLHLTKLLEGSVLKKTFFWCCLAFFAAPIIPTMMLLALSLVCFGSLTLALGTDRTKKVSFSPLNMFIIIYAVIYMFSSVLSVTPRDSLQTGLLVVVFVLFSIVFESSVKTRRQLDVVIALLVVSGGLVALYGIYQYISGITGDASWVDTDMFSDIRTRVFSTLGNPNVLSEYLLLVIPFACAGVLAAKHWFVKIIFLGFSGVMLLCMLLTYSRGGWLALLIAAMLFLVIWDRRFIILGIVGIAALFFILPETIVSRFTSIGNIQDSSTSYRLAIWIGTLSMLSDYWLCGVGPGISAFNKTYPLYSQNAIIAPHSHNLFLQIVCEMGIAGLIVFFIILYQYFKMTARALSQDLGRRKYYLIAAISSITGFLVQGLTDSSFYNHRVMFMFWVVLIIGALLAKSPQMEEGKNIWFES